MTQDTPLSVWPGIVTPSESRTNTMVMAGTTSTAGAKLIYQVHLVTCFTEQSTKPLPLDRLLEFSMLPLLPVSNADHRFFTWTEVLLEPCQHTSFSDLTSAIASKLKFPEQVPVVKNNNQLAYTMACKGVMWLNLPVVERSQAFIQFVLVLDVHLKHIKVQCFLVKATHLCFPFLHTSLINDSICLQFL